MLYGRTAEIAAIDEVVSRARGGAGGALVLRGEAGVGKTALLDLAVTRGGGMRVLRTTGVEPESDLAFAALHQVLRPVAGLLGALPGPQREAVGAALGLAGGGSGDRFLLAAGVLSLLAEAAAPDGLVCVVDDFQWVDRASADALLFAARRLSTEPIVMLLAVRGDAPVKGVPSLPIDGLTEAEADELLNASITPPSHGNQPTAAGTPDRGGAPVSLVAGRVRRELVAATAGNPLALRETVRRLTEAQLAGREPLPDPLPGGTSLFGEQIAALPAPARLVALLAAIEGDLELVLRAAERLGAGREALDALEAAGLARVSGASVRFRHPLIRSAVHEAATPAARRGAHAVLAELADGDRRAWHLAAAALGQDEPVAAALAETAARALGRGGYGDAATALTKAAELTPEPLTRATRLKDAAMAAWLGGRPGLAESLLAEAREHAGGNARLGAEIAQLRGRFELNSGNAAEAVRILAAGETLEMLADAAEAASYVGDTKAIIDIGRRAAAFPESFLRDVVAGIGATLDPEAAQAPGPDTAPGLGTPTGGGSAGRRGRIRRGFTGRGVASEGGATSGSGAATGGGAGTGAGAGAGKGARADAGAATGTGAVARPGAGVAVSARAVGEGHGLLRRALGRTGELREAAEFLWASAAASYLGEADLSAELIGRAGQVARVSGMVGQLPVVLEFVATAERIAGRLAESRALSEEALELAREAGYVNTVAAHLANLAVLAALRGDEDECRRHAQEALAIAIPHRVGLRAGTASYALAMLDLCQGRYANAHDRFTALVAAGPGAGQATVVWRSTPDRIEAAVGAGEVAAAGAALEAYERWSASAGTRESQALLARCRALVAGDGGEEGLAAALRLHDNAFEAARTALLLGERLRRAHRPGEARAHLRTALEAFRTAGAQPWARRAHGELRAAGESAEAPPGSVLDALTPQELRIAGLVADGLSSKEIAAQLFLSPRTVEYHLYKIYPKLGIGTRTELARLVVLRKAPVAGQDML